MAIVGVAVAFGSVMYLVSRDVSLGLSLLVGTGIIGMFSQMGLQSFAAALGSGLLSPMTIQLVLAVALLSGLGKVMKESGDLEQMVSSLGALFRKPKLLTMLLPSLIGTVNVPGGAIMSAPMVEENGRALALDDVTKASINLLFRHIGYHVYPLHTSLIILSELLDIPKQSIIKHNVIPMLVGIIVAYLVFYRGIDASQVTPKSERSKFHLVKDFLLGFSPILVILGSVLILKLPFFVAVAIGLVLALMKNLPSENRGPSFSLRLKKLFVSWIDYKLALVIISLMVFKSVIEASGVTTNVASSLLNYGISLPILVLVLGFVTSYIIGTHMAASGILAALFAPIFPQAALGPYASLLLFSIMLGYLISPLHLCLVLTNQYFGVSYGQTLKKLIAPILAMLTIVVVQLFVFL